MAVADGKKVEIRLAECMTVTHAVELSGNVLSLSWGLVSNRPCVAAGAIGDVAVIVDAESGEIVADLFTGALGLVAVSLSNGGALAVFADSGVGCTLFDLSSGKASSFVPSVMAKARWHHDGRFVVLISFDGKQIIICDTLENGGVCVRRDVKQLGLRSVAGLKWVRRPDSVVIWGDALDGRDAVTVMSIDGRVVTHGKPKIAHVLPPSKIVRHENCGLGLKKVVFSKDCTLVALGNHDGTLRFVHIRRWVQLGFVMPARPIVNEDKPPVVFKEIMRKHESGASTLIQTDDARVEVARGDDGGKGITQCAIHTSNIFVAAVAEETSNVVCVYEVDGGTIVSALVLLKPVTEVKAVKDTFVILTDSDQAFIWRTNGAGAMRIDNGKKSWRAPPRFGKVLSTAEHVALIGSSTGRCFALYVTDEEDR